MKTGKLTRPKSLAEIAAESFTYEEFGYNTKDFLHEYASALKHGRSIEPMLKEEPAKISSRFKEGNICDAFLAGLADYLSRENHIVTPEWAQSPDRVLEKPWFSPEIIEVRAMLLRDTPSAFKEKNIFIFENALNVA